MIKFLGGVRGNKLSGVAIVRLDFNANDDWRMRSALPTLNFLIKAKAKILILSHKGRPLENPKFLISNNQIRNKFSLRKEAGILGKLLKRKVSFINNFDFEKIKKNLDAAQAGSVFVLENLRFLKEEEQNNLKFARSLASLGDYYINDAFAVSHRANASVAAITKFLPSYAGFGFKSEIENLGKAMQRPRRPLLLIVGGGKPSDKVEVLKNFKKIADRIIIGGAVANTILAIRGVPIGDSIADRKNQKHFKEIAGYKNLVVPVDLHFKESRILDIGERTVRVFESEIAKASTIIWNGPLGLIEDKKFDDGTLALARAISRNKKSFSLAGGGETVMFIRKHKLENSFDFISTGGGAMLDFLAGKKLPGIQALEKNYS